MLQNDGPKVIQGFILIQPLRTVCRMNMNPALLRI